MTRYHFVLAATLALIVGAIASGQSFTETGTAPPPEGRPPLSPLRRTDSRRWEVTLHLTLPAITKQDPSEEALIVPVALLDTWSIADPSSFRCQVYVDGAPYPPSAKGITVIQNSRGDSRAIIPLPAKIEERLQADVGWVVETASVELDESAAARIPWPDAWPPEVERWRKPSQAIESEAPAIAAAVKQLKASLPADIPPVYAAKEVIRAASRALRNAGHSEGSMTGVLQRGVPVWGAARALDATQGGPADLACIAVAYLRAAGFPARPTMGLMLDSNAAQSKGNHKLALWGEVYLPQMGWVPFDVDAIRGGISPQTDVTRPWKGFGTDRDAKDRIPITHELLLHDPKGSDTLRTASFAALCRLLTRLDQPGQGAVDILVRTTVLNRGRGG